MVCYCPGTEVHNLKVEVFPFVVNADSYSPILLSNFYGSIEVSVSEGVVVVFFIINSDG